MTESFDKSTHFLQYTDQIKEVCKINYGPILYLYRIKTNELVGPLICNTFLPGMLQTICKFLNISADLTKKIGGITLKEDFLTAKKVLILIQHTNEIIDAVVLKL